MKGNTSKVGRMEDIRINSSLDSQWWYRIDAVDEQINEMIKNILKEQRIYTNLNAKLTY